jgi:hypothetical protein
VIKTAQSQHAAPAQAPPDPVPPAPRAANLGQRANELPRPQLTIRSTAQLLPALAKGGQGGVTAGASDDSRTYSRKSPPIDQFRATGTTMASFVPFSSQGVTG